MNIQLNRTQHRILAALARKDRPAKTAADLAEAVERTRTGVYNALTPLCEGGYVDGVEDDSTMTGRRGRPSVHLSISSKGRQLLASHKLADLPERSAVAEVKAKAKAPAKAKPKAPAPAKSKAKVKVKAKVKPKAPAKAKAA